MFKNTIMTILLGLALSSCGEAAKTNQVVLKNNNVIILADEVNDMTVAKVLVEARKLDSTLPKGEPIYLVLNTPGGSVTAGLELVDVLKGLDRKVHTITIFAASMGFQIAQQLDDRIIVDSGTLMSHKAYGGVEGEFGGEGPSQLNNRLDLWTSKIKEMDEQTVKRSNGKQTLESYTKAYENELWLTSSKAIAGGYADRASKVKCDKSLSGTREQMFSFFGMQITVIFSNCPVITGPLDVKMSIKTRDGRTIPLNEYNEKGGMFGTACSVSTNQTQFMCPLDSSLSVERIEQVKKETLKRFSQEHLKNNIKKY